MSHTNWENLEKALQKNTLFLYHHRYGSQVVWTHTHTHTYELYTFNYVKTMAVFEFKIATS